MSLQLVVTCPREPSDAAWERSGEIAARILKSLAERDLRKRVDQQPKAA